MKLFVQGFCPTLDVTNEGEDMTASQDVILIADLRRRLASSERLIVEQRGLIDAYKAQIAELTRQIGAMQEQYREQRTKRPTYELRTTLEQNRT